jgi:hypothetical protein
MPALLKRLVENLRPYIEEGVVHRELNKDSD